MLQALGHTPYNWSKGVDHTHGSWKNYLKKYIAFKQMFDSFVIELTHSDTSSDKYVESEDEY